MNVVERDRNKLSVGTTIKINRIIIIKGNTIHIKVHRTEVAKAAEAELASIN